jgi:hypothetical protein
MAILNIGVNEDWLFKMREQRISNPINAWSAGVRAKLFTETTTLRLSDGKGRGEPHWIVGDRVFVVSIDRGQCFAVGHVVVPAVWNDSEWPWRWEFELDLYSVEFDNPPLVSSYGIVLGQGSRKTIDGTIAHQLDCDMP